VAPCVVELNVSAPKSLKIFVNLVDDAGATPELLVGQEVGDGIALSQAETVGRFEGRNLKKLA
jgi:hypothetical protein